MFSDGRSRGPRMASLKRVEWLDSGRWKHQPREGRSPLHARIYILFRWYLDMAPDSLCYCVCTKKTAFR